MKRKSNNRGSSLAEWTEIILGKRTPIRVRERPKKPATLFIGRWQPFHGGHKALVETALKAGKNVVVACRDTPISDKNPYTFQMRYRMIHYALRKWEGRVDVILIPDIDEVAYGRDVGYKVTKIDLAPEIESVSGTAIRAGKCDKKSVASRRKRG